MGLLREGRQEACQRQGSLGDGEGRAYLVEGCQLVVGLYDLHGSQVDATQHDMGFATGLDIGLQGWLPIQLDGNVDHCPTLHQTVGRGVCPSASEVDAHG